MAPTALALLLGAALASAAAAGGRVLQDVTPNPAVFARPPKPGGAEADGGKKKLVLDDVVREKKESSATTDGTPKKVIPPPSGERKPVAKPKPTMADGAAERAAEAARKSTLAKKPLIFTYFSVWAKGPSVALALAHSGLNWEGINEIEDWTVTKPTMPWGMLPSLEVPALEMKLGHEIAILKYIADTVPIMAGVGVMEKIASDQLMFSSEDIWKKLGKFQDTLFQKEKCLPAELDSFWEATDNTVNNANQGLNVHLRQLEDYLATLPEGSSGKATAAGISVGEIKLWTTLHTLVMIKADVLAPYPSLNELYKRIGAADATLDVVDINDPSTPGRKFTKPFAAYFVPRCAEISEQSLPSCDEDTPETPSPAGVRRLLLGRRSLAAAAVAEGGLSSSWVASWQRRLECWWMALPVPTQSQLGSCMGAFGLHLGSRLETAGRAAGLTPQAAQLQSAAPEDGCEWLDAELQRLQLPSFPDLPQSEFRVPPLPQLLPSWQRLQSLSRAALQHRAAADGGSSSTVSYSTSAALGLAAGLATGAGFILAMVRFSRRDSTRK